MANRLLRRVRDYAQVRANGIITAQVARDALSRLNVAEFGLDDMDGRLLRTILAGFAEYGDDNLPLPDPDLKQRTLEEVYEPYLIQQGFLERTARGGSRRRMPTGGSE